MPAESEVNTKVSEVVTWLWIMRHESVEDAETWAEARGVEPMERPGIVGLAAFTLARIGLAQGVVSNLPPEGSRAVWHAERISEPGVPLDRADQPIVAFLLSEFLAAALSSDAARGVAVWRQALDTAVDGTPVPDDDDDDETEVDLDPDKCPIAVTILHAVFDIADPYLNPPARTTE